MSDQYQPKDYYDWPNREHGHFLHNPVNKHYDITSYDYVPYNYYGGDEIHSDNVVFRQSEYVTYDLTHIRMVNRSDIHMYDTSGISIFDSGTLTLYTSATPSARKFVVDEFGRVGIGLDHHGPHGGTDRVGLLLNRGETPSFDLDVRGQVGVEDYIYHNDNTETYMLFGSDLSAHDVNEAGEIHTHYPDDQDEINFRVGGVDMMQMQTRDVFYAESGTTPTGVQDHITFNKYQSDVDFIVRSVDEPNMLFIDSKNNRVSIGDSEDAPQATLEVKNDPSSGAFDVPLVQFNNKDTDKQLLDINADNINADVISVSADELVTAHVMTVTADSLTTGDVYNVTADSLTTGSIFHATTTSSSKEQVSLFHLESTGDRGHDVYQTVLMDLNFDTTAGRGARAFRIDSEQTTGKVVEIDAQRITSGTAMTVSAADLTTGKGFEIGFDSRTTGTGVHIVDTSSADATGSLVKIEQLGDRAGWQHSTGIDINFDTTGNPNSRTIKIDTEQIDGTVIEVDATQIRTGKVLDIDAQRLMSGTGIELHMDLRTTGTGLHIHDDAVSDHAGALVKIEQEGDRSGTAASVGIDVNFDTTNNPNSRVLRIDSEQRDGTVVEIDATEITSGRVLAIDADKLTTGKGIELLMDTRTTGTGLHIHDDAISDHAGALVKIEQEGDRSGSAASHVVDINMDTTNNVNSRTIKIDTEQRDGVVVDVDATEITTGKVLSIDAQKLTTGKGIELTMNNRTTGTGVHVTDTSTTNTPGALMKLEQLGDRGGDQSNILLDLNVDTTNNPNSRTIRIDSEQKNGTVIEVDATPLTTGKALHIHTDTRTSGELIHLHDAGTSNTAGAMVKIEQDGDRSGTAATHVVDINMDTTNNPNSRTIKIDTEQRDGTVVEVDATEITSGRVLAIDADKLTTGKGIELLMDNRTTGTGLHIHDDSGTDSAGRLVYIEQKGNRDGTQASIGMEINFDTTSNVNARAFKIDSEQTTGVITEIDGYKLTSGTALSLRNVDNLSTGTIVDIHSNSGSTNYRDLVKIHNDNTVATGVRSLYVLNDAKADRDGTVNVRGETVRFETTAADTNPLLELRNSNTATNTPPILNFIRSASNEANDMSLGTITFEGKDSGNVDTVYAEIRARATDKDNTTEAGEVSILVQATDSPSTLRNLLRIGNQEDSGSTQQAEVVINEDQIDCDFRVETNTSNNAFVIRGDGTEIVINENSTADHDLRVESNNSSRMFFVDTSLDYVEIKGPANDDSIIFDIIGNNNAGAAGASLFRVSPTDVVFNESSNDVNFRIEADTTDPKQSVTDIGTDSGAVSNDHLVHNPQYAFFVDGSNGRVGLGTGTPDTTLHVAGSAHIEGDLWVKGVTNQVDTFVHVTSAMDITNKGTGPALTVTQDGAQPVAAFYDGNNAGSVKYPALYIENGGESGPGNVGIGTTNPEYDLEVLKTGRNDQNTQIAVTTHSTGTHTSDIILQKSRGSESSPAGVNDNDIFGRMVFQGWNNNASAWNTGAMIHARVHGDPHTGTDTSDMPGELVFSTTGDASNVATERMRIMHTGRVGIGSSATNPMNIVQVDHTGGDLNDGILIVRNDTSIGTNDWLGGIGFDGKDGNVPSSIKEASAYIGAYATESWSTGDKGAKLVFGVAFNDDDDDTTTNQPMEIDNTGTVTIKNNHNGNTGLFVDNDHTTGNGTRTAMFIDMDISGTDAATTDRNHYGLNIDVDSSYTGGDNSNEGRLHGARISATSSGDNDIVYGAYILGQTSGTATNVASNTTNLYGAYIQADQNRATLNSNQFGVYAISNTDNQSLATTVGVTNSYGVFGKHLNNSGGVAGVTTAATGGYFHVECDEGTITTATGVRSRIDRDGGSIGTGYLFKGNYEGIVGHSSSLSSGTRWGIHITEAGRNAIEGHLQLGSVTSGLEKTYTTLYVEATDGIRVPVGTTDQRPANSAFGITAESPTDAQYVPKLGTIRYNTTQSTFEGFGAGNQWGSLGGVIDPDRDTYWTAVNDLDNLHNPGGNKYGTDEFTSTDYPGDVDYLRAFTSGIKRFAITNTGESRWYYKNDGDGSVGDPYTYQPMLKIYTTSGGGFIEQATTGKSLNLYTDGLLDMAGITKAQLSSGGGTVAISAKDAITLDGTGISLDSDAASNFSTSAGGLTLKGHSGITFHHGTEKCMATTANGIDVLVDSNTSQAEVRIYGSGQSSAKLYVGQSLAHGGGILYNGDDNPAQISTGDRTVLYRTTTSDGVTSDHEVASWFHTSNNVRFAGDLTIKYDDTAQDDIEGAQINWTIAPDADGTKNYIHEDVYLDKTDAYGHGTNRWLWRVFSADANTYVLSYDPAGGTLRSRIMKPDQLNLINGNFDWTKTSGWNSQEIIGPSGWYVDVKNTSGDDFDGRIQYAQPGKVATGSEAMWLLYAGGNNAARFTDNSAYFAGDIVGFYDFSDARLKKNITALDSKNSLDAILKLQGVEYEWNDKDGKEIGFVAQDVEPVVPQVISEAQRGADIANDDTYKRVDYEKMVALLVEGMKEQQSQIDQLKQEIAQLKQQ